jgi:hypothetical protein
VVTSRSDVSLARCGRPTVRCDAGVKRRDVLATVDRLTAGHWCASSARRRHTSVTCELTSATRELTSGTGELTLEKRDVTSIA